MIIGILQVELMIDDAESLKGKRSVVKSLKDRLHREHQVSVAEVDKQDVLGEAVLGIVLAGSDTKYVQSTMDKLAEKLKKGKGFYLHDYDVQLLTGR